MANVIFKRGLQKDLPQTGVDGALYVTTDTSRIYMGVGEELKQLSGGLLTAPNIEKLPSATEDLIGSFYYVIAENVLCYCEKAGQEGWIQINPDAHLTANDQHFKVDKVSESSGKNTIRLTSTITDNENNTSTGTVDFVGEGIVSVSQVGNTITINGTAKADTTYTIGAQEGVSESNSADVTLTGSAGESTAIKLQGNDLLAVAAATGSTINIGAKSQKVKDLKVENNQTSGFKVSLSQDNNTSPIETTFSPKIKLGSNKEVEFVNGIATLETKSSDEIDQAITSAVSKATREMNAMEYKGTIGGEGATYPTVDALLADTKNLHNGDVYKAGADIPEKNIHTGDLIIVQGKEDEQGIIPTGATINTVLSGEDVDTRYNIELLQGETPSIQFNSTTDTSAGQKMTFQGSDDITINGAILDKTNTVTIAHKVYSAPTTDEGQINDTNSSTVISGLTVNNGHVTGIKTKSIVLPKMEWGAFK